VINRNIINPNINYNGLDRNSLFLLINKWKSLLLKRGACKGDVIALAIMSVNPNHVAAIFACAELGLKLFLFSRPIARETLHATKMGTFGPLDYTIVEEYMWNEDYNREMFERYGGEIIWQNEVEDCSAEDPMSADVSPSDTFLFASTSGSTGVSKAVYVSHEDFLKTAVRSARVFNIQKDSRLVHNMNMHHASAMMTYLIPGLMFADTHFYGQVTDRDVFDGEITYSPEKFVQFLLREKITHTMCGFPIMINLFAKLIKQYKEQWSNKIIMNISGFTVPERFYQHAKETPFVFYSHYGAVDVTLGSPLLLNKVDSNSKYEPNLLGKQPDNFFEVNFDDLGVSVTSKLWEGPKRMSDRLDKVGDMYFHIGRSEWSGEYLKWNDELGDIVKEQHGDYLLVVIEKASFLVLWDAEKEYDFEMNTTPIKRLVNHVVYLKKQDFQVDTKIDMAQLRAYLEHHYD